MPKVLKLLGFKTHAHYVLEERMAKSPEDCMEFLEKIYTVAYPAAKAELEEIKDFAKEMDGMDRLDGWDFNYYSTKLKKKRNISSTPNNCVRGSNWKMSLEGLFLVANKIYGITLKQVTDVPVYHKDVTTWEVYDEDNAFIGLIYLDMFPRETKRGGAWMNSLHRSGFVYGRYEEDRTS